LFQEYKNADNPREGLIALRTAMQGNEDVNEGVIRRVEELVNKDLIGITYTDSQMRQLGVKSGARAKAYNEILKTLTPEQRMPYMQDQINKGILTPDVQRQLIAEEQFRRMFQNNAGTQN
jgi:hypothetical protein